MSVTMSFMVLKLSKGQHYTATGNIGHKTFVAFTILFFNHFFYLIINSLQSVKSVKSSLKHVSVHEFFFQKSLFHLTVS